MISIPTVDSLDVRGRRVFCRVDYNVPIENGVITDTTRIDETLPTLRLLRERGARIILAAISAARRDSANPKYSLAPVRDDARRRSSGAASQWAADCVGAEAERRRGRAPGRRGAPSREPPLSRRRRRRTIPSSARPLRRLAELLRQRRVRRVASRARLDRRRSPSSSPTERARPAFCCREGARVPAEDHQRPGQARSSPFSAERRSPGRSSRSRCS